MSPFLHFPKQCQMDVCAVGNQAKREMNLYDVVMTETISGNKEINRYKADFIFTNGLFDVYYLNIFSVKIVRPEKRQIIDTISVIWSITLDHCLTLVFYMYLLLYIMSAF